jgi:anhydro-N-acetylmuramic acid kinase
VSKSLGALGLMSGTSLDGIDVAFLNTDGETDLSRGPSRSYPYTFDQRERLRQALRDAATLTGRGERPGTLAATETELTHWHASAVERFCEECGVDRAAIDVIGFHGQTVIHRPERRLTVQLGDGALLARLTGCKVIADLRAADIAAGGQGAPLVPVYHRALASHAGQRPVVFVNIGGVGNVTWIGGDDTLLAFDTGPGNALLDDWVSRHTGEPFDRGGRLTAQGMVDDERLTRLMENLYFALPPPKSLDRNAFSLAALEGLSPADGAATLVRFTAMTLAGAAAHFPEPPKAWIVCGGGRRNPAIMRDLGGLLEPQGQHLMAAEALGIDGDTTEAEAWAYLAVRSLRGLPITFPGTTGVARPQTGGTVHDP